MHYMPSVYPTNELVVEEEPANVDNSDNNNVLKNSTMNNTNIFDTNDNNHDNDDSDLIKTWNNKTWTPWLDKRVVLPTRYSTIQSRLVSLTMYKNNRQYKPNVYDTNVGPHTSRT